MNIRISYTNSRGKTISKDFCDPMDVIGYIYRCYAASRNAAQTKEMNARLFSQPQRVWLDDEKGGAE